MAPTPFDDSYEGIPFGVSFYFLKWVSRSRLLVGIAFLAAANGGSLGAQDIDSRARPDTASAVAGPRYAKGGFYGTFFGTDYRDLWTTAVEAEVLDLGTFAGGLSTTGTGGGFQTLQVRFPLQRPCWPDSWEA